MQVFKREKNPTYASLSNNSQNYSKVFEEVLTPPHPHTPSKEKKPNPKNPHKSPNQCGLWLLKHK